MRFSQIVALRTYRHEDRDAGAHDKLDHQDLVEGDIAVHVLLRLGAVQYGCQI